VLQGLRLAIDFGSRLMILVMAAAVRGRSGQKFRAGKAVTPEQRYKD
jgi:hypothetical protein